MKKPVVLYSFSKGDVELCTEPLVLPTIKKFPYNQQGFRHVRTETGRVWNPKAMTFEHAENRLKEILNTMDIPSARRYSLSETNCRWALRNLGIRNGSHENYEEAVACLKTCLRHYEDLRRGKEEDE